MIRAVQKGDTLVEVMIAMAIIGLVLGLSYATASRSLRIGRQAQERTEALKLLEGQVEALKLKADTDIKTISQAAVPSTPTSVYADIYTTSESFCLSTGVGTVTLIPQDRPEEDMLGTPGDSLISSATGAPTGSEVYHLNCSVGVARRYKLSIVRADSSVGGETISLFTIRARWDRIGGGKDEIKFSYRLNRSQFLP